MIYLNCDYADGVHPKILEKLIETNDLQSSTYGTDIYSEKAKEKIKELCNYEDCDIYFIAGGTLTNLIVISSCLKNYQGVISADTGHINTHESGAIENSGHKVLPILNNNGKLEIKKVENLITEHYEQGEGRIHTVQPKMVYISNPTEFGTIYTRDELKQLYDFCKRRNLFLYIDGARLGYALAAKDNDIDLEFLANHCDLFYIGGTKLGAMYGEALVITNPLLRTDFKYHLKQNGALTAKGRFLGIQFLELFENNLYFKIAKKANDYANILKNAFLEKNYKILYKSNTNLIFVVIETEKIQELSKEFAFEIIDKYDDNHKIVRFATSWNTKEEYIKKLLEKI